MDNSGPIKINPQKSFTLYKLYPLKSVTAKLKYTVYKNKLTKTIQFAGK